MDEYIKSFGDLEGRPDALEQRERDRRVDPRIPEAGKLIDSAKKKEASGDFDGAESDYNDAIDALKGTTESKSMLTAGYFARGRYWELRGEDEWAIRDYSRAIKHTHKDNRGDRARLHAQRAGARRRIKQHKGALSDYNKALRTVEQRLIELREKTELAAKVTKLLKETASENAEGIAASVQKAKDDTRSELKSQDAKDSVEHAELEGVYAGWQTNRGLVLTDMGDDMMALEAHTIAIDRAPNAAAAWSNRAGMFRYTRRRHLLILCVRVCVSS